MTTLDHYSGSGNICLSYNILALHVCTQSNTKCNAQFSLIITKQIAAAE